MDERADALDRYQDPAGISVPAGSVEAAGDPADLTGVELGAATPETAEIRSEIEETRAQMSATIDAIQEKLNPQTIVEQVKDTVKETTADIMDHAKESVREATVGRVEHMVSNATDTARDTGSGIVEMVKNNPVPAALLGLGLGWFFLRNQNGSGNQGRYDNWQWAMPGPGASRYSPNNYATPPGPGERYRGAGAEYTAAAGGQGNSAPESAGYRGQDSYPGGGNGSGGLMETIRQNPLPAAAAAVSLGWLLTRGNTPQPQPQHPNWDRYGYGSGQLRNGADGGVVAQAGEKLSNVAGAAGDRVGNVANAAGDLVGQAGNKVGDVANAAGDTVGNVASAAGDLVGQAGSKVGDAASTAGDLVGQAGSKVGTTVGDVTEGVQYQAQRAQTGFQQMFTENPLAIGAVAVALGAALGLAVPQTEQEHRLLGPARDNLVEKAQEVAQDTMQKVQQVTDQVQQTVQQTAQDQGLTV